MENTILVYTDKCLTCTEERRMTKIYEFARANKLKVLTRRTNIIPEWDKEAKELGADLPFLYFNGKVADYKTINNEALQNLL